VIPFLGTNVAQAEEEILNSEYGSIEIEVLNEKKEVLKDVELSLFKEDTLVESKTTNNKGIVLFSELEYGEYYLKQTRAPEKYILNKESKKIEIAENKKDLKETLILKLEKTMKKQKNVEEIEPVKATDDETNKNTITLQNAKVEGEKRLAKHIEYGIARRGKKGNQRFDTPVLEMYFLTTQNSGGINPNSEVAFCVEPGVPALNEWGYIPNKPTVLLTLEQQKEIEKIVHFGFDTAPKGEFLSTSWKTYYVTTKLMIEEYLGWNIDI